MNADQFWDAVRSTRTALAVVPWWVPAVAVFVLVLAGSARKAHRRDALDRWVDALATMIGLGWSSQGMWDTAVHRYDVTPALALVLFFMFEAFLISQMLKAHRYRADRPRRGRYITAVWVVAAIMGAVVALGEGWAQAPLRIAVPMLVAYNWWLGITAEDDPAENAPTSIRWTPRRFLLWIKAIEPGKRDAKTIDRDRLAERMTLIGFRRDHAPKWTDPLGRRAYRLARMALDADDDLIVEVERRRARGDAFLAKSPALPAAAPTPVATAPKGIPMMDLSSPRPVPAPPESTARYAEGGKLPQGATVVNGVVLRGSALHQHATDRLIDSVSPDRPNGMSNAELVASYSPPLGQRTAESIAAAARRSEEFLARQAGRQINGKSFSDAS